MFICKRGGDQLCGLVVVCPLWDWKGDGSTKDSHMTQQSIKFQLLIDKHVGRSNKVQVIRHKEALSDWDMGQMGLLSRSEGNLSRE